MNICVWSDGTWCYRENLEEFLAAPCAMSDDFMTVDVGDCSDEQIEVFVQSSINGE